MTADTKTHHDTKVPEKPVEAAEHHGAGTDASNHLSQQATKPNDHAALAAVKPKGDASPHAPGLPHVQVVDHSKDKPAPPHAADAVHLAADAHAAKLDPKTLETTAREMHEAIHQQRWHLWGNPDTDKIKHLVGTLNEADRKALEKTYQDIYDKNGPAGTLRKELKDNLGEADFRRTEATLNSHDGKTNDAGALKAALAESKNEPKKGGAEVRAVLQNLNSKQLDQLDADYKQQFGQSYKDALKAELSLDASTTKVLPFLEKGVDHRTAQDLVAMAKVAADQSDSRLLEEAVRGDSPEAKAARAAINGDAALSAKIARDFSHGLFTSELDPGVRDLLKDGRTSLTTIVNSDIDRLILKDKANVDTTLQNATPDERKQFVHGRELAQAGKGATTDADKKDLDFYDKLHGALTKKFDGRQASMWEDELAHGRETIVSQLGHTYNEGFFGIMAGNDKHKLLTQTENLSKQDWEVLNKKGSPEAVQLRSELETSLKTYAPDDANRVMELIDKKAAAGSYEESGKIHRNFEEVKADNTSSGLFGTSYDTKNMSANLVNMTAEDAAKYKADPVFRASMDKFVGDHFDQTQKVLAHHVLDQVAQTGKTAAPDKITTTLNDVVQGASSDKVLGDTEDLMRDPAMRAAFKGPEGKLSAELKEIKVQATAVIDSQLAPPANQSDGPPPAPPDNSPYLKALFENGHLTADQKSTLGFSRELVVKAAAEDSPADRAVAINSFSADEQAVVKGIMQNADGKPDLADRIRLVSTKSGGTVEDLKDELRGLSYTQREALKDEYTKKYGKDMDGDLLSAVDKKDQSEFSALLKPADTDARSSFLDNFHQMLRSENGWGVGGSQMDMERASDRYEQSLEQYQKIYQTLPADKQQALDNYFNQALTNHRDSKQRAAELASDAVIAAAAVAASVVTGGASLALVLPLAFTAGGVIRNGVLAMGEGADFDSSDKNLAKQFIVGGTSAASNFIGAEIFMGAGKLATGAAVEAVAGLSVVAAEGALKTGGREILESGLTSLIKANGKDVTEAQLAKLAMKACPESAEVQAQIVRGLSKSLPATFEANQARVCEEIANRTWQQHTKSYLTDAVANSAVVSGTNAFSELAVSPFNDKGVDWQAMQRGAIIGAGVGMFVPVALRWTGYGASAAVNGGKHLYERLGSDEAKVLDPSKLGGESFALVNSRTGTEMRFHAGENNPFTIMEGHEQALVKRDLEVSAAKNSRAQSDLFAHNHEISAPLHDGFSFRADGNVIDRIGTRDTSRFGFTVELKPLEKYAKEAQARLKGLETPAERAEALTKYVHEKFGATANSKEKYLTFAKNHPNASLDQYVAAGVGTSSHEAVFLKVLGDKLGMDSKLVVGHVGPTGGKINHAWTTFDLGEGPKIFDPRRGVFNPEAKAAKAYHAAAEAAPAAKPLDRLAGPVNPADHTDNRFSFEEKPGWHIIDRNTDGTFKIGHEGSVDAKLDDLKALNAEQLAREGGPKIGQNLKVEKAGHVDESYHVSGVNPDGSYRLSSATAEVRNNVAMPAFLKLKSGHFAEAEAAKGALSQPEQSLDHFYETAQAAVGFKSDAEVKEMVKARISEELANTADGGALFRDRLHLHELNVLARDFGLQAETGAMMAGRLTRELSSNSELLSNPAMLSNFTNELKMVAEHHGMTAELERATQVKINSMLGKSDTADLLALARAGRSIEAVNAVKFFEANGFTFKGAIAGATTDTQLKMLGDLQAKFGDGSAKSLEEVNQILQKYNYRAVRTKGNVSLSHINENNTLHETAVNVMHSAAHKRDVLSGKLKNMTQNMIEIYLSGIRV